MIAVRSFCNLTQYDTKQSYKIITRTSERQCYSTTFLPRYTQSLCKSKLVGVFAIFLSSSYFVLLFGTNSAKTIFSCWRNCKYLNFLLTMYLFLNRVKFIGSNSMMLTMLELIRTCRDFWSITKLRSFKTDINQSIIGRIISAPFNVNIEKI